ncbi:MAG: hypothetical protein ACYDDF_00615 [Thermoplasmatota archaeon]
MRKIAPLAALVLFVGTCALLPLLPLAAASTSTTCMGGQTDPYAVKLSLPNLATYGIATPVPQPSYYLSTDDMSIWVESNGVSGLQRTAEVCYTDTYNSNGAITSATSTVVYAADTPLVP